MRSWIWVANLFAAVADVTKMIGIINQLVSTAIELQAQVFRVLLTFSRQGSRDLEAQATEVDRSDEAVDVQEPVGSFEDRLDLVVQSLDGSRADAQLDGLEDSIEVILDGLCETDDLSDAAASCPSQPASEPCARDADVSWYPSVSKVLFEQVAAIETEVVSLDLGELRFLGLGQVHRVFQQRPACVFESFRGRRIVAA